MLRKNLDDLETNGQKGDWAFLQDDTYIAIRYSEKVFTGMVIIPVAENPQGQTPWQWNGSKEAPTLSPSILVQTVPGWNDGWHGWLRDGKLVTCE